MHESLEQVMSSYNAYDLFTYAIYLNNVYLTVLLEMVCITYQIGYAMHVSHVLILCKHSLLEHVNVIRQTL